MSSSLLLALLLPCLSKLGRRGLDLAELLCSIGTLLLVCLLPLVGNSSAVGSAWGGDLLGMWSWLGEEVDSSAKPSLDA